MCCKDTKKIDQALKEKRTNYLIICSASLAIFPENHPGAAHDLHGFS